MDRLERPIGYRLTFMTDKTRLPRSTDLNPLDYITALVGGRINREIGVAVKENPLGAIIACFVLFA